MKMTLEKQKQKRLVCVCGASARDTSKERGRFLRRHPQAIYQLQDQIAGECLGWKAKPFLKAKAPIEANSITVDGKPLAYA